MRAHSRFGWLQTVGTKKMEALTTPCEQLQRFAHCLALVLWIPISDIHAFWDDNGWTTLKQTSFCCQWKHIETHRDNDDFNLYQFEFDIYFRRSNALHCYCVPHDELINSPVYSRFLCSTNRRRLIATNRPSSWLYYTFIWRLLAQHSRKYRTHRPSEHVTNYATTTNHHNHKAMPSNVRVRSFFFGVACNDGI